MWMGRDRKRKSNGGGKESDEWGEEKPKRNPPALQKKTEIAQTLIPTCRNV